MYSVCSRPCTRVSMTDAAALALRNRIALPDNILCLINTGIINHLLRSDFITTSLVQPYEHSLATVVSIVRGRHCDLGVSAKIVLLKQQLYDLWCQYTCIIVGMNIR